MIESKQGEREHLTATYKKKLIEVALPLEAINKESAREKSIRHGHPRPCISGGRVVLWPLAVLCCGRRWSMTRPAIRTSSRPKRRRRKSAAGSFASSSSW